MHAPPKISRSTLEKREYNGFLFFIPGQTIENRIKSVKHMVNDEIDLSNLFVRNSENNSNGNIYTAD